MEGKSKATVRQATIDDYLLDPKLPGPESDEKRRKRYGWSDSIPTIDEPRDVDKRLLGLDRRYQRDATSVERVREYAANWDPRMAGSLLVAKRADGSLWVVDGGHRYRAAMLRGDVKTLHCVIFESSGVEEEARLFREMAKKRKKLSALDAYRSGVTGGDPVCTQVDRILGARGWSVSKNPRKNCLCAIGTFVRIMKIDAVAATAVLDVCIEAQGSSPTIDNDVLDGLFVLMRKMRDRKKPIDIFSGRDRAAIVEAGVSGMMNAIRAQRLEEGKTGGQPLAARGILFRIINKGRRPKLAWFEEAKD